MNCKQGDLAIVIYSGKDGLGPNLGKIILCKKVTIQKFEGFGLLQSWITEPMLINVQGIEVPAPDRILRPISPLSELNEIKENLELFA